MKATHSLTQVKGLIQNRRYRVAIGASNDAGALGFDEADILDCVLGLTDAQCYKTMESTSRPGTYQDVYHVIYCGEELYVKFVITEAVLHIVSFKPR